MGNVYNFESNPLWEIFIGGILYGTITGILPMVVLILIGYLFVWTYKGGKWAVKARNHTFSWNPVRFAALIYTVVLFAVLGWGGFKLFTWIKEMNS